MTVLLVVLLVVVSLLQFGYLAALNLLAKDVKASAGQLRPLAVELRSSAYLLSQKASD